MSDNPIDTPANNSKDLPNAVLVLVLGISSIPLCFCYGIPGLVVGIVALVLANTDTKVYQANPDMYSVSSYQNLKAGKICAVIGVSLSALYFLAVLAIIAFAGFGTLSEMGDWNF